MSIVHDPNAAEQRTCHFLQPPIRDPPPASVHLISLENERFGPAAVIYPPTPISPRRGTSDGACSIFRHPAQRRMESPRRLPPFGAVSGQAGRTAGGNRFCRAGRPGRTQRAGAVAGRGSAVSARMDLRSGSLPAASEEKTRRTLTAERRGYPATQKNRGRQRAGLVEKPWPDRFGGLGDRRALLVLCSAPERAERVIHVGAIDPDRNFDHVRDRPSRALSSEPASRRRSAQADLARRRGDPRHFVAGALSRRRFLRLPLRPAWQPVRLQGGRRETLVGLISAIRSR